MANRFIRNSYAFDKNDRRRKGFISDSFYTNQEYDDPAKKDRENRKEVIDRIENLISEGCLIEDAVLQVYSDETIRKNFEYLEKRGIDLKKIFGSWYEGHIKRINDERNITVIGSNKKRKLEER